MTTSTVLLDTNVFTAWLRPQSPLVPLYGKHVIGHRITVTPQTVVEVPYGAIAAGWGVRLKTCELAFAQDSAVGA